MGWFSRAKDPEDTTTRLERLEKAFKQLEIEWTDTYDKFRRLHMRVAKQAQRLDAAAEPTSTEAGQGDGEGARPSPLSERQESINRKILERRARMAMRGNVQ